jgi:quinol-cytochrome oxidoreductase complex cytochrome b subunit
MKYNEKWAWGTTRFYPHEMANMAQVVIICLAALFFFSIFAPGVFIPREEPANPTNTPEHIKPEWYFMGAYQALKEFKTISIGESFKISGTIQGILFQVFVLMAMFFVPFWENGKQKPGEPVKANKIALTASVLVIIFLIMGIVSNLSQETGFSGIVLHLLGILGFATLPFWGGTGGRSVRRKKPLYLGTLIAITGFVYLTVKGIMI